MKLRLPRRLWPRPAASAAQDGYDAARRSHLARLGRLVASAPHDPVLVYQMGSVGSQTVSHSLAAFYGGRRGTDAPVFHMHYLTAARVAEFERRHRAALGTPDEHALRRAWDAAFLRDALAQDAIAKECGGRRWKIVTLVRDPMARNVTDFFKRLRLAAGAAPGTWRAAAPAYGIDLAVDEATPGALRRAFLERYDHAAALSWFDRELQTVLGIDVYAHPYPPDEGGRPIRGDRCDLLILRAEDLDARGGRLLAGFLGTGEPPLANTNRAQDRPQAPLWSSFRRALGAPAGLLDTLYGAKLARHFYRPDEIAQFRASWAKTG